MTRQTKSRTRFHAPDTVHTNSLLFSLFPEKKNHYKKHHAKEKSLQLGEIKKNRVISPRETKITTNSDKSLRVATLPIVARKMALFLALALAP